MTDQSRTQSDSAHRARGRGAMRRAGLAVAVLAAMVFAVPSASGADGSRTAGSLGAGARGAGPALTWVGQIARQDVPVLPTSEADTLVEPDIAVSPKDSRVALAVAHDGRYPDGGAVGIETAWTGDGGKTWTHRPLPGVTTTTGGVQPWTRASDPVAAYAADGTAYVSTLLFNAATCDSAVAVSRSSDGGKTFAKPVLAHEAHTCAVSDDKNWLVVDTGAASPNRGRLYQFWTAFTIDLFGNAYSPQALVISDDGGRTWSAPIAVSAPTSNTQNSQPMILPNGTLVDTFMDYGRESAGDRVENPQPRARALPAGERAPKPVWRSVISTDGGVSWRRAGTITDDVGDGPSGIRCCLASATIDPVTKVLYAAWNSTQRTAVKLSTSTDGRTWSRPVVVNRPKPGLPTVNVDVAARDGAVMVSYGLTNASASPTWWGRQYVATSLDRGRTFLSPKEIGPPTDYAYAAFAGGRFPGDYIGSTMGAGRAYTVWAVASRPSDPAATYHQVLYAAVFDTRGLRAG
ncbi:MAG: exo-alpha-sialidase [Tetrasphaera sp.]|nr:exo-alpha-sialidase [Tetrasphaera sp.]